VNPFDPLIGHGVSPTPSKLRRMPIPVFSITSSAFRHQAVAADHHPFGLLFHHVEDVAQILLDGQVRRQ
jgi:hypothetical protein